MREEYIVSVDSSVSDLDLAKVSNAFDIGWKGELVRCKECRFAYCLNPGEEEKERLYQCFVPPVANLRITHKGDWYCADGRRK